MRKKSLVFAALAALAVASGPLMAQEFNDGIFAAEVGDYKTAVAKWEPLAENGDADAQFNMALIYHKGLGVDPDEALAVGWYHRAANSGNPHAQEYLSVAYNEGWFGLPRNPELAHYWENRLKQQ